MAIITCPHCGKTTSDMEENCLHCKQPVSKKINAPSFERPKSRFFLAKLWRGEYSLAVAFWFFYFSVNFAINAIAYTKPDLVAAFFGLESHRWFFTIPFFMLLYIVYVAACVVGVWRSASRYTGAKIWAGLARVYVVLSAMNMVRLTYDYMIMPLFFLYQLWRMGAL